MVNEYINTYVTILVNISDYYIRLALTIIYFLNQSIYIYDKKFSLHCYCKAILHHCRMYGFNILLSNISIYNEFQISYEKLPPVCNIEHMSRAHQIRIRPQNKDQLFGFLYQTLM